jgi:peptidoglycan-associated lipoprotein
MSRKLTVRFTALLLMCAMSLAACKSPPTKALSDAEKALLDASSRRECANDKYLAAEKLLKEAKALVEKKKYKDAERKAIAAQKMAEDARKSADASWEECQRRKNAVVEATKPVEKDKPKDKAEAPATLSTLYFAYDSAEISPAQREQLEQNALWMRQNPNVNTMIVEGHTDERGSVEYNLALGERRAQSVRQYLMQLGIERDRLSILSYGEEKPVAYGGGEDDYRQNRRVEFKPKEK